MNPLKTIKQLFCKHCFKDITTKPNKQANIQHWRCRRCEYLATCWGKARVVEYTANPKN